VVFQRDTIYDIDLSINTKDNQSKTSISLSNLNEIRTSDIYIYIYISASVIPVSLLFLNDIPQDCANIDSKTVSKSEFIAVTDMYIAIVLR
jgi:hypothetical protein